LTKSAGLAIEPQNSHTAVARFRRKQIIEPKVVNVNDLILKMNNMLGLIGENIELVSSASI
jgi:hypothetical protein